MKLITDFSSDRLTVDLSVTKWLVRDLKPTSPDPEAGRLFSVAKLKNGSLVYVALSREGRNAYQLEIYEFEDFIAFCDGAGVYISCQPPNCLIRAVAKALGVTHIKAAGKDREINEWFKDDVATAEAMQE